MYSVKVIEDSISPVGDRITTISAKYPRIIHSELMTHGLFSKNASSSRAIPISKLIEFVRKEPFIPIHWGRKKKGMQAGAEIRHVWLAKLIWLSVMNAAIGAAWLLDKLGLHKQLANRLIENFGYINVVITATDFDNFMHLRYHKDAMPEIQKLAYLIGVAIRDSKPKLIDWNMWHCPFVSDSERLTHPIDTLLKISAARCARVSYLTFDGKVPYPSDDLKLYEKLVGSDPKHMSPLSHQGQCVTHVPTRLTSNLRNFLQYRKTIPGERLTDFDYTKLDREYSIK